MEELRKTPWALLCLSRLKIVGVYILDEELDFEGVYLKVPFAKQSLALHQKGHLQINIGKSNFHGERHHLIF